MVPNNSLKVIADPVKPSAFALTVIDGISLLADKQMNLVLSKALTLSGTIKTSSGVALVNTRVVIGPCRTWSTCPNTGFDVLTDANGHFSASVSPGTYNIVAFFDLAGLYPGGNYIDMSNNTFSYYDDIIVTADKTYDITLPLAKLSGKTTDENGVAVPNVLFTVIEDNIPCGAGRCFFDLRNTAASAGNGDYALFVVPNKMLNVTIIPPDSSGFAQTEIKNINAESDLLQAIILTKPNTASIYGKVTSGSGSGTGLGNITVILFNAGNDIYIKQVTTDTSGNYIITGLTDGVYHILFEDNVTTLPGYARQYYTGQVNIASASTVTITNQASATGIDAVLVSGGAIRGKVTNSSGAGISGIPVYTYYASQATGNPIRRTNVITDSNGNYTVRGLTAGNYKVQFNGGALLQSRFYNNKPYLNGADVVAVTAGATSDGIDTVLAASTATLSWAGVTNSRAGNGSDWDAIDAGINSFASTLTGMTLKVTGPEGFTYTFVDADRTPYLNGQLTVYKQYPSLVPGIYTFTLTDSGGNALSTISDTHTPEPTPMPLVDTGTISYTRQQDDSYRFSWSPVSYATQPYYRIRISLTDGLNTPIYLSTRNSDPWAVLPVGTVVDGNSYLVRVEAHDAPTYELVTNRSNTVYVPFNPSATVVNGVCGSSSGGSFATAPSSNLCNSGTAEPVPSGTGPWNWLCKGSSVDNDAICRTELKVTAQLQTGNNIPTTPTPAVNLNFTSVTTSGTIEVTSTTGPGADVAVANGAGYSTVPGTSFDITNSAVTSGLITVCIAYNPVNITVAENLLRLLHNNGTAWEDITTSVDTVNDRVCGQTASLSPFVIGYRKILKAGDCNGDGAITIDEVQNAINMYLGLKPSAVCVDLNGNGVTIDEVQKVINGYLGL